jgi:hypothetical protein
MGPDRPETECQLMERPGGSWLESLAGSRKRVPSQTLDDSG